MSYESYTWKDRISSNAVGRLLTYEDHTSVHVDVARDEGTVLEEGTPFDASHMNGLELRIGTAFDLVTEMYSGTTDPSSGTGKNGDIYIKLADGDVDSVFVKISGEWLALPTGGGSGATVYVGTTDPSPSLGENGNLYAKYHTDTTPVVDAFYVKISGSWASVSTGGGGLVGLELTQAQYNALTPEEKMNGTVYFVTDANNLPDYESLTFPLDEGD